MLSDKMINEAFVEVLMKKIPKKTQLANFIAETLSIEKETAYRRLRGVSMFTFNEVAILAHKLNFSVDEIIINTEKSTPITDMMLKSYYADKNEDIKENELNSENYVEIFAQQPDSKFGMALKSIPFPVLLPYDNISKYYKFKYVQHENNPSNPTLFKDIKLNGWDSNNMEAAYYMFHQINHTIYIWDKKIIPIIVDDIKYFKSLGLMDNTDIQAIQKELLLLMDDLEATASKGVFEDTGKKCDIYISDEDIDSTYTYFWSEKLCLSVLITHLFYAIMSYNNKSKCKEAIDWITSMKSNSTLISGTGGKERVLFFNQQRDIIETL